MRPISASQIDTYQACPRKWAWKYLDHIHAPTHPKAELGTKCHTMLEQYYQGHFPSRLATVEIDDMVYSPGRILCAALKHLPLPKPDVESEQKFELTVQDVPFVGYIDVAHEDTVYDLKTTSSLKYIADKNLRTDVQAVLYAHARHTQTGHNPIHLRWVYTATSAPPHAAVLEYSSTTTDRAPHLQSIVETARELMGHYKHKRRALDLAPAKSHCSAFGGCGYKQHCFPNQNQPNEEPTMDPPIEAKRRSRPPKKHGFTLLINCIPIGAKIVDTTELLRKANAAACQDTGTKDWQLIEYGRGPAHLRLALEEALDGANIPDTAYVCLDTRLPAAQHTLDVWIDRASVVIRGI